MLSLDSFHTRWDNRGKIPIKRFYAYCKECSKKRKREDKSGYLKKYRKEHYATNRDLVKAKTRAISLDIRQKTIALYGGKCAMCGISEFDILTIDHIHYGGRKHVRDSGGCIPMYRKMLKDYRPDLYQVLCYNCNCGKKTYQRAAEYSGKIKIDHNYRKRKRFRILSMYGDRCVECGITDLEVLTLDHINNDGKLDREINGSGTKFIDYLDRTGKRDDLVLLCWNCNCRKAKLNHHMYF